MTKPSHYYKLKSNLIAEPLVASWYAWCNLVAPASGALTLVNHRLPILESYLKAPKEHDAAVKLASMRGGTFLDAEGKDYVSKARVLLENTKNTCADLFSFAEAVKNLNILLEKECGNGFSMSEIYEKIPSELKGYTELVYDLNNRPFFRFVEPLLYKSKYYKAELQTVKLSFHNIDERPFVLSTPRFLNEGDFLINKPFFDDFYDMFFKTRFEAVPLSFLEELYKKVDNVSWECFLNSFDIVNADFELKVKKAIVEKMVVKYFGHACLLLECGNTSILVDPLISYNNDGVGVERFSFKDLPDKIDYVLITHAHLDHLVLETLLQIRHKIGTIIVPHGSRGRLEDPSIKLFLQYCGFKNVVEISELEKVEFENGQITALPFFGEHADLDISKLAYSVVYNGKNILCMADSNNLDNDLYRHIKEIIPKIDDIFLGMECDGAPLTWLYGAFIMHPLSRQANLSRRLNGSNAQRAFALINEFNPKRVFIYAMGSEPWISYISSIHYDKDSVQILESDKLISMCQKQSILSKRLYGKDII